MKQPSRLTGSLLQNIPKISEQFQYEQDAQGSSKKKSGNSKNVHEGKQVTIIKKTPIYKLYSSNNPMLKDEYSILAPEAYKKIIKIQQQKLCQEKIQEWIDIGYHIHILQAFKLENLNGKLIVYIEKVQGKTLRDWINTGFFQDKNKFINSKRILNVLLQVAVGLHYLNKKKFIHQQLNPDNIFVENQKCLKIGNMYSFNGVLSKLSKSPFIGGSPEYWSYEQGNIYQSLKQRSNNIQYYLNALKLLPDLTIKSDLYQFGLLMLEITIGKFWIRGDKIDLKELANKKNENVVEEIQNFILQKAEQFMRQKPQERAQIGQFIEELLDIYDTHFKNPEDLLWMKYFDEIKYESDLLNNKAVGLYLAGNEIECEKTWIKSLASNPQNLIAQFNYSHYRRMKRAIDDIRLNKELLLMPQSRKRNFYIFLSNLVNIPLLKEPFKCFNINPKLSRGKQIQIISNIIQQLNKFKKAKDYIFQKRFLLQKTKFQSVFIIHNNKFVARFINNLYIWNLNQDVRSYNYTLIKTPISSLNIPENRTTLTTIDISQMYLAMTQNNSLCIFKIDVINDPLLHYQIKDYGSNILTIQFDQRSEVLGIGSNQFTIKLINLVNKQICRVINIGQKFIIDNLRFYDRNSCFGVSFEKSIAFYRIESGKPLYTIRSNATVATYRIVQNSVNSHIMIVLTTQKFQIWNLKDKTLMRNIEIDEAPDILDFLTLGNKKIVVHFSKNMVRIWNYGNGLILKSFKSLSQYIWSGVSQDYKYLYTLTQNGTLTFRNIQFDEFLKNFQGICIPNQLALFQQREENNEQINNYIKYGKILIKNLNDYRLNQHDKKVSLQGMYATAQLIKTDVFYQDKLDIKTIFKYLNGIKQSEEKSSKINAHSEQYIFTSRKDQTITAVSNLIGNNVIIGQSTGIIRIVELPSTIIATIKLFNTAITFVNLEANSIFVSSGVSCAIIQRQSLSTIVSHNSYHKQSIMFGMILNNIFVTGDQQQTILFWNKDKIRRYIIPVSMGQSIGNKLILVGFDNRIRLYDVNQDGLKKLHVFIGHTMPIYRIVIIDDGIFASYSYDGTIRWWNIQAKVCFNYYQFKKYFKSDNILYIDLPKFSLEEQKHPKFDREGCALVLLNNSEIVVFDVMRKQVKYRLELVQDINKIIWIEYPNSLAVMTNSEIRIYNIYWRYMVPKKPI